MPPTNTHTPQGQYTILSQGAGDILRLVQQPYATTLQAFTDRGCGVQQISLDHAELQAFLRALPRETLRAALAQEPTLYQDPVLQRLLTEETRAPVVITAALRGYPAPGTVCACEAQPSVHIVNGTCSPFLREEG